MATDLERIQEMKDKLLIAFDHITQPPHIELPHAEISDDPRRLAEFHRAKELMLKRHIEATADSIIGLSNSFASLVLAETALITRQVPILPKPGYRPPSGGRDPQGRDR
jgi:hypothetical protein